MARRFDLRHLDAFLAVCESLHFGQAADRLCLSQPALTRTIQQLETALGVALFERDKRNVALTDVGMTLRDHARKLVEQARAAETDVQRKADGRVGRLAIAYIDFAMMGIFPEILQKFRHAHPRVAIHLSRMPTDLQRELIQSGDVDVGFLLGNLTGQNIESLLIEEQSLVALLPSHHPLAGHDTIGIATLLRQPLVLGSLPEFSAFRRLVAEEAGKRHIQLQIIQETSTSDGILAVLQGLSTSQLVREPMDVGPRGSLRGPAGPFPCRGLRSVHHCRSNSMRAHSTICISRLRCCWSYVILLPRTCVRRS